MGGALSRRPEFPSALPEMRIRAACILQFLGSRSLLFLMFLKCRVMRQSEGNSAEFLDTFSLDTVAVEQEVEPPCVLCTVHPQRTWQATESGFLRLTVARGYLVVAGSGNGCDIK